jgi:mono/diheme cytochrome c family protein
MNHFLKFFAYFAVPNSIVPRFPRLPRILRFQPPSSPAAKMPSPSAIRKSIVLSRFLKFSCLSCISWFQIASSPAADDKITYQDHIRPIFESRCFGCHNPDKMKGGLDLTNYGGAMTGSSGGEIVNPGSPGDSTIILTTTKKAEPFMPPEGDPLTKEQIDLISKWIAGGVLDSANSSARKAKKPAFDMKVSADATGKPEGPPPMPEHLLLEPVVVTTRPAATSALATSPWAPLVAISGQKQVLLYNTDNLQLEAVLPFPEGFIESLSFSRNGSILLAGGGRGGKSGKVIGWEVKTGKRVIDVGQEFDAVLASDISADHGLVALGSTSKKLKIYNTSDGSELHAIKKHTDWITSLAFSNDGILIASGDRAGNLYVWEAETGILFYDLRGHTGAITGIAWRSDSNILATSSEDKTIRLWEMTEGKEVKKWDAHGEGTLSLDFHRNGNLVSTGRDMNTKVFAQDGNQIAAFKDFRDMPLITRFTHDGERIIVGDWYGEVTIWDKEGKGKIGTLPANPPAIDTRINNANAAIAAADATAAEEQKKLETAVAQLNTQKSLLDAAQKAMDEINKQRGEKEAALNQAKEKAPQALAARDAANKELETKKDDPTAQALVAQRNKELEDANNSIPLAQAVFDEANKQIEPAKAALAAADETVKKELEAEKAVRATTDAAKQKADWHKKDLVRWQAASINTIHLAKASQLTQIQADLEFAIADHKQAELDHASMLAAIDAASQVIGSAQADAQKKEQILAAAKAAQPKIESDVRLHQVIVNNAITAHQLLSEAKSDAPETQQKFAEATKAAEQAVTSAQNHLSQLQTQSKDAVPTAEKHLNESKAILASAEKDVAEKRVKLAELETRKTELTTTRQSLETQVTALREETEALKAKYLNTLAQTTPPATNVAGN